MNRATFKDVANSKRDSLAHDIDDHDEFNDDADNGPPRKIRHKEEGEEEEVTEKFNDAGEVMEPFNLKEERQNGFFDETGAYVFQKDKGEVDAWMETLDEATMERQIGESAKALERKRNREAEAERKAEESGLGLSLDETKLALVELMRPGETVAQAMRRLSAAAKASSQGSAAGKAKAKPFSAKPVSSSASPTPVSRLIDLADYAISAHGMFGVYSLTMEELEAAMLTWEYKSTSAEGEQGQEQLHGPFTTSQMAAWRGAGYFTGPTAVMVRKIVGGAAPEPDLVAAATAGKKTKSALDMFGEDCEDDEEEGAGDVSSAVAVKVKDIANAAAHSARRGDWVSSDSINFSDVIRAAATAAAAISGSGGAGGREGSNRSGGSSSSSSSSTSSTMSALNKDYRRPVQPTKASEGSGAVDHKALEAQIKRHGVAEDSEDDDDDDADNAQGGDDDEEEDEDDESDKEDDI